MAQVSRRGRSPLDLPYAAGPTSSCIFLLRCLGSCSRHPRCALLCHPIGELLLTHKQRPSFFAVRLTLGLVCSLCEAKFYRSVVEHVSDRVGRYMLCMLFFNAGMWNASTGTSCWCRSRNTMTDEFCFQRFCPQHSPCTLICWQYPLRFVHQRREQMTEFCSRWSALLLEP